MGLSGKVKAGVLAFALLATAGGTPFVLKQLAEQGYDVPSIPAAEKVMALLDARSPGERTQGKLTKNKASLKKLAESVGQPKERALGKIINPEKPTMADLGKVIAPPAQGVEAAPPIGPLALADVIPAPTETIPGGSAGGSVGTPLLVGGGGGGVGGAGGGGGGGGGVTQPPPAIIESAVPEPSTWMMMLLGFGVIGSVARRERRSANQRLLSS